MRALDSWRTASSFLPRRTALRIFGASAVSVAVSACSSNGIGRPGISGVALGKFAAGAWKVSSPTANYKSGVINVTEAGTWTIQFADNDGSSNKITWSGAWNLAGQALQITLDDHGEGLGAVEGTASSVPLVVAGDASAHFSWQFGSSPDDMQVSYNSRGREITIVRQTRNGPQTITAVRA